ncbi:DUF898 family protein [Chelatococcus sp. SYSU_G07232]|uniref:DUF898 family protein n=1 Tax=Chelatococcus albus TaxID=3047466 RepID=A0ABT7AED2_9HYPH|nr:DUF898 family protein [Chelatococcus sp. SYSU_G07232]MDJ1157730.1 DUF898 family protein [Chelatococcus sp. SYSU_G07232]
MSVVPSVPLPRGSEGEMERLSFAGERAPFLRLVARGSLLQLPTLGFYRFWLVTDIRRHLWAHTRLGREAFEYTGTARELLIGFLVALTVLAPIYVVYFLVGLEAERLEAFASLPLFVVLYLLGQYASYRARRYRATRTVFRGLRFWMTGSAWAYAGRAALWDGLTLLTLGLAYPWRAAALERYKLAHTRFGDLSGDFASTGWVFFKRGVWLWLVAVLTAVVAFISTFAAQSIGRVAGPRAGGYIGGSIIILILLFAAFVIYPLFRAIEMRWVLEGLRFGPITVASDLSMRSVFACYARTLGVSIAYALVGAGGIALCLWLLAGAVPVASLGASLTGTIMGGVATGAIYLLFLLGFGIIRRLYLERGLWAAAVASISIANLAALDDVAARGTPAGALGEGLADALDVGGF